MSINIQEYENNLNIYNQQITAKKNEIANAERELIVAQTQLKNYEQQAKDIEEECLQLTGKSIDELENVITKSMTQLDKIMKKVTTVSNISKTSNLTDEEMQDIMQFTEEELS